MLRACTYVWFYRHLLPGLHFCAALVVASSVAYADAIDGTWCSPDGARITINGEDVVTPGGNATKGAYTRHSMVVRIPAGESGAGKTLYMVQLHENAVRVTTIAEIQVEPGPHEEWTRCHAVIGQFSRPPADTAHPASVAFRFTVL